ncbi:MAG TPA: hypothetical protein VJQ25_10190 [Nitrospira sp.]|nr:hypothetical protein [Nitrospira sp.]
MWLLVVLEKRIPLSRHEALIYLLQAWLLGPLVWVCLYVKISLSKRSLIDQANAVDEGEEL